MNLWKLIIKLLRTLLIGAGALVTLLICYVALHHLLAGVEKKRLHPPGTMVNVNGYRLHAYALGEKTQGKPTYVILSAMGMPSPVYFYHGLMDEIAKSARVCLVERAGMGYSEFSDKGRDLDTLLQETREALQKTGETGPFVLLAHSLGGFEARYWASRYPEEIKGIIGMDMLLPEYELAQAPGDKVDEVFIQGTLSLCNFLGIGRLEFLFQDLLPTKIYHAKLSPQQSAQDRYLMHIRFLSPAILEEMQYEKANAQKLVKADFPECPVVLLVSNPEKTFYIDPCWREKALELQQAHRNVQVVLLDCDHHLHLHEQDTVLCYVRQME